MLIDWFTVLAQIVNFLVLLVLLKIFLYDRIIKAMDRREERIAKNLQDAKEAREKAEADAARVEEERAGLQAERNRLIREAKQEAEAFRREQLGAAREEIAELKERWRKSVRDEQARFLSDLEQRAAAAICAVCKRIFSDLADEELEKAVVNQFISRLSTSSEDMNKLRDVEDGTLHIVTAFDLPEKLRTTLNRHLRSTSSAELRTTYEQDPELICGIELRGGGMAISWNVTDYLDALRDALQAVIKQNAQSGAEPEVETQSADAS